MGRVPPWCIGHRPAVTETNVTDILPFLITGLVTGTIYGLAGDGPGADVQDVGDLQFRPRRRADRRVRDLLRAAGSAGAGTGRSLLRQRVRRRAAVGTRDGIVARNLSRQRTAMKIVGTVGLTVLVPAICLLFYPRAINGLEGRAVPSVREPQGIQDGGSSMSTCSAIRSSRRRSPSSRSAALYAVFRYTRLGVSMRAAVDDPDLLDLMGTSPVRVRRIAWMIGMHVRRPVGRPHPPAM